ncbi:uncharacterized protein LOC103998002 isoform X2 [Musa acuminata AAA Group]|uniref:uncharacterized protein LOC103998002 isoform X2 n=1 Tax=Musa acuminata AAA Group TaxID=214697 RepID=UPI0031D9B818
MRPPRCPHRNMVGRGADGRPDAEEDPSPAAAPSEAGLPGVDLLAQARKALSFRCPFDAEESTPRVPTLPSGLASFLLRASEGHRKHKKSQGETSEKPLGNRKPSTVWDETEEFFRPVTLDDIDMLVPKLPSGPGLLDSCLAMQVTGIGTADGQKYDNLVADAVELSSISSPKKEEVVSKQQVKDTENVQAAEEAQQMEVDKVVTVGGDTLSIQGGDDDHSSLHWILGSKERFVLTSERPNKKRKLLGGDAGLDRILLLPNSLSGASLCDFCCSPETRAESNKLLRCHSCNVLVHQKCYGVHEVPEGVWLCAWCKHLETTGEILERDGQEPGLRPCLLCPKEGGALKMMKGDSSLNTSGTTTKFMHLFCSLWTPEVHVVDTGSMELAMNMGGIEDRRRRLVCNVCKVKHGVCIRCSHGTCRTSFHPLCARESKHQMEIWGKFGCDNVELRVFCSKHYTIQGMDSVKDPKNMLAVGDHSLEAEPSSAVLAAKRLPKLRFTRKSRDKSMVQNEITNLNSEKLVQMDTDVEQNAVAGRIASEGNQAGSDAEMDSGGVIDSGNNRTPVDVAAVLRKLIDRGKISADEVAAEMGISLDSLQAALVGETTSFSPGLRLKIIKWLQSSIHMSALQQSRVRSSPAISSDIKGKDIDGSNAAAVKDPENKLAGDKMTDVEVLDAVLIKSLPPRRRTKNNIRILKNNKALHSSGVASVLENGNRKIVDETDDMPVVISEDVKGDINGRKCSNLVESLSNEQNLPEMIIEDMFKIEDSIFPLDPNGGQKRSPSNVGHSDLSDAEYKVDDAVEKVSSLDCKSNQADANTTIPYGSQRDCSKNFDTDNVLLSSKFDLENDGFCSISNIHPLIKKKLLHMQNSVFFKNNPRVPFFNDSANILCPSCTQQRLSCSCTGANHSLDMTNLDQLSKAKRMGILGLSPEDEVEGEIIYLQARLLDNDVVVKHSYEDLLLKIVQNLSHELNASNKHKWDLILVNQFLREVREAKKRGRKERRHKEAQAVLAAAAAAAAASSRNSSLRKDSNDEIISATQESSIKVNAATGRAGFSTASVPRAREALRSSVAKLSSDKHSLAFQMPDLLKDNALSCEICMRTETILNRIFVCSSCKVAVHLDCYRRLRNPIASWKCELCEDLSLPSTSPKSQTDGKDRSAAIAQCGLCGGATGAFRKSADGQWVHALCAEWLLEPKFRRGQENLVEGMDTILKEKDTCGVCYFNFGACLKCSYGHCQYTFHPSCARAAGFYMNAKATGASLQHKAYCGKHSIEQREADNQQCGAEDLKSLKQIRVELEKLRLLCERIIKREKLKKELVLCSHDILASRRDCVAYSVLVRSSFFPTGTSSESATTSINNRSYSGTVQRSDEITVDSTVSGKNKIRFSLNNRDFDRNTDDSSTSQLSYKWKLANRESFAGKQLPRRSTSIASRRSAEDGEKNAKARKTETFQKELVMTSDQASMQNQRLPKGFFYVPVGSLSKEKPITQDLESCEPRELGG